MSVDGEAPAVPAPATPEKPKRSAWASLKDNIETTVAAVLVALMIRQYVIEPYKIPTGSMGPSLHGVHRDILCPTCRRVFETGCEDSPSVRSASYRQP